MKKKQGRDDAKNTKQLTEIQVLTKDFTPEKESNAVSSTNQPFKDPC